IARTFALAGRAAAAAAAAAANAMAIETALARVQQPDVVRREPRNIYHRVDRAGPEQRIAPMFPWGDYLPRPGIPGVTAITVNDPAYYTEVAHLLETSAPDALRDYLAWTVLRELSGELGRAWVTEAYAMAKELDGVQEVPPRWRRCVERTDRDLGELL